MPIRARLPECTNNLAARFRVRGVQVVHGDAVPAAAVGCQPEYCVHTPSFLVWCLVLRAKSRLVSIRNRLVNFDNRSISVSSTKAPCADRLAFATATQQLSVGEDRTALAATGKDR